MYDNIGNKIKSLAIAAAIFEAIASMIAGVVLIFSESEMVFLGIFLFFFAPFIVIMLSLLGYGFGDLIDNVSKISKSLDTSDKKNEHELNTENNERKLLLEKLHVQGLITEEEYLQLISKAD